MLEEHHPTMGAGWVIVSGLMSIVLLLREEGFLPISFYGMFLGGMAMLLLKFIIHPASEPLEFDTEQFMYVLLPPIVLNSGLKFKWAEAQKTIGTSLVLAWLGTVGTALWIALGLWSTTDVKPWIIAFWIGSILSPTDPVGTLDQMAKLNRQLPIKLVLEHESLLNDAVAVMLVHTAHRTWKLNENMTKIETIEVIGFALGLTVLAALIGALHAFLLFKIEKIKPLFVLTVGMFVFSACEVIEASGIIALFVFGAVISVYGEYPETSRIIQNIADFSETYVYISMGGVVVESSLIYWKEGLAVILATLTGRIMNVHAFTVLCRVGGVRWNLEETIFMSICGMRGAVSLALAISSPMKLRTLFVTVTVMEVFFSMVFTSVAANWCIKRFEMFKRSNNVLVV